MTGSFERIEVITGVGRRRRCSVEEKARIVAESFADGPPRRAALPAQGAYARLRRISRPIATLVLTADKERLLPVEAALP